MGEAEVGSLLQELGATVAATQPALQPGDGPDGMARALAQRLDGLGYEAVPARHGDEWQVEAFNCVFHALARQHPQVCKFDLAYMEARQRTPHPPHGMHRPRRPCLPLPDRRRRSGDARHGSEPAVAGRDKAGS